MVAVCRMSVFSAAPNIVYILADDMGVGDISALNPDSKIQTPNLDRMVADGMVFSDAHTASVLLKGRLQNDNR